MCRVYRESFSLTINVSAAERRPLFGDRIQATPFEWPPKRIERYE